MTSRISSEVRAMVSTLRAQHFSYPKILECLASQGVKLSYSSVKRLCTEEKKTQAGWTKPAKRLAPQNLPSVRTKQNIAKVKNAVLKKNPEAFRKLSRKLEMSVRSVGRIIHENLGLEVRKEQRVHMLTDTMKKQRYSMSGQNFS